jgi:GntR family transcriptional regulator
MAQQHSAPEVDPNPFATDAGDELPVGLQLAWRLRALIATGQLAPGERLPSFRRLAEWAGVNVNTVRSVYEGLEADGVVVSRQGQGTFVAAEVEARPELEEIATDALRRAAEAGLDGRDLAIVALACASMPEEDSETLEVRRELRRQIARLEAELARHSPSLPDALPTAPRRAVAHVAGVEELEQTRDTLIAQLSEAQQEAERRSEARERGPLGRAMSRWRAKR